LGESRKRLGYIEGQAPDKVWEEEWDWAPLVLLWKCENHCCTRPPVVVITIDASKNRSKQSKLEKCP
jgi:hypothetical protein